MKKGKVRQKNINFNKKHVKGAQKEYLSVLQYQCSFMKKCDFSLCLRCY